MGENTVNFVIPTLGRYTLHRTLDSLRSQTDPDWKAYVIFDNHDITIPTDDRILAFRYDKPIGHGAGTVRNYALPMITGGWLAFVDDDDWVDKNYVDKIIHYGKRGYDLISFTYRDVENGNIQPPPGMKNIVKCNIGISFAIKTDFVHKHNIKFIAGGVEDYEFINECVKKGASWIITGEILYFVGHRSAWGNN